MAEKTLAIFIKGDSGNALKALQSVRAELAQIASLAGQINKLYGKGAPGGGKAADPVKGVADSAEEAGKKVQKLRGDIDRLFKGYGHAAQMPGGGVYTSEAFLKDLKQKATALSRAGVHGKDGVNLGLIEEAEGYVQRAAELSRQYDLDINKRIRENSKRTQAEAGKAVEQQEELVRSFHAGDEFPFYKNLEREARAAERGLTEQQKATRSFVKDLNTLESSFTKLSNTEKGTSVIRRRGGEEIRRSADFVKQYRLEYQKAVEIEKAMLEAMRQGGLHLQKGRPTEFAAYTEKQTARWSGKGSATGLFAHSEEELKKLREFAALNDIMPKRVSWIRDYTRDVTHMMKMQARWFTGAGLIFGGMAAIGGAIKGAVEFQKAIKEIGAVTGATERDLGKLADRALQISLIAPQSAVDLAKAASVLVKAGLEVDQVNAILDDVAKTATVSGDSLEAVGAAFSTAIMAWSMSTNEAQNIGNILAATLNYSRLNIEDLATAYNYVASTSSQFNLSFEETNAALAVFSNLGIRASTMATSFTQFLSNLADPSKEFKKTIEESGKSFEDFAGILDDDRPDKFARVIKALSEASFTTSDSFKSLEVRTARLVNAGLNVGADAFFRMNKRIRETQQLTGGFKTAMEATANKWATFKNRMTAVGIHTFNAILPAVDVLVGSLKTFATILIYVSKGLEFFGNKAVWVGAAVFGAGYTVARLGKEIRSITKIVAMSRLIFASHPLFMGIAALTGVMALVGWLTGAGKDAEKFSESIDDTAEAMKRLAEQDKKNQKIYEESQKLLDDFKRKYEELTRSVTTAPPSSFVKWREELRGFDAELLASKLRIEDFIGTMKSRIREMEADLNAGPDGFWGWIVETFAVMPETPFEQQKKHLQQQVDIFKKMLKDKEEQLKKAQEKADAVNKEMLGKRDDLLGSYFGSWQEDAGKEKSTAEKRAAVWTSMHDSMTEAIKRAAKAREEFDPEEWAKQIGPHVVELFKDINGQIKNNIEQIRSGEAAWKKYLDSMGRDTDKRRIKDPMAAAWREGLQEIEDEIEKFAEAKASYLGSLGEKVAVTRNGETAMVDISAEDIKARYKKEFDEIRKYLAVLRGGVAGDDVASISIFKEEELNALVVLLEQVSKDIPDAVKKLSIEANNAYLDTQKRIAELTKDTEAQYRVELAQLENKKKIREMEIALIEDVTERSKQQEALNKLTEKETEELGKQRAKRYVEKETSKLRGGFEFKELMGGNAQAGIRYTDFWEKINKLQEDGAITAEQAHDAIDKMYRAMDWGNKPPGAEAWVGFVDSFKLGVGEATRQLGDAFDWTVRLGKDAVNTLQRSSSDFFYNLSTAQGFDQEEHSSFWRYFQDVVDDFLKSVYQSFMRSLSDIWSAWLTGGIMDLLGGVLNGKNAMNNTDQQAIVTSATLTGTLMGQVGVVGSLTTAYWALGAAKMFAGMGGGWEGIAGSNTPVNMKQDWSGFTSPWVTGVTVPHTGGFIPKYHNGGKVLPSERMALLEVGEFVVNRRSAARNKEALMAINNGQDVGGGGRPAGNNITIIAADAKSFSDMVKRNPGAIVGVVNNDLRMAGSTRTSIRNNL